MAMSTTKNTAGAATGVPSPDALVPMVAGIRVSNSLLSPPSDGRHIYNGHSALRNIPHNDSVVSKDGPLATKDVFKPRPSDQHFINMSANDIMHIKNAQTSRGRL